MENQIYPGNVAQTSLWASVKVKNEIAFPKTEAISRDASDEEAILLAASLTDIRGSEADTQQSEGWPVSTRESNRQRFHYKIFE